jgi:hypothetical protein
MNEEQEDLYTRTIMVDGHLLSVRGMSLWQVRGTNASTGAEEGAWVSIWSAEEEAGQ